MKTKKTISANWVVGIIILILGVFIFSMLNDDTSVEPNKVAKVKLAPVNTIQKKEHSFMHIPENYLIDFYTYLNGRQWKKMASISVINFNAQKLEDHFSHMTIKGFKIIDIVKNTKLSTTIKARITFINVTDKIETKEVNVRLTLASDYQTWLISPFTAY